MSRIEENISKYIFGYTKPPEVNDLPAIIDKIMVLTIELEKFLNNIPDDRKREVMKKNVSLAQQLMVDNMEIYNEWLTKQAREF